MIKATFVSSFFRRSLDFTFISGHSIVENLLEQMNEYSKFEPLPCKGTYFQLMSYANISDDPDTEFAKWLTTEHDVATIPISVFYGNKVDNKVIRFCFAKTDDTLKKAAKRLVKI